MKKILMAVFAAVLSLLALSSCGVGNYSVASGKADECAISFTSAQTTAVEVTIDGNVYNINSVKDKAWKTDRKIKPTAKNTLYIKPGQHDVSVTMKGTQVYSHKIFVSAGEHKVIEL